VIALNVACVASDFFAAVWANQVIGVRNERRGSVIGHPGIGNILGR